MNREQKAQFVDEIRGRFENAPLVILTEFKGSTVLQMDLMRRACESDSLHFQVVKNTLCKLAIAGTKHEPLADHFRGNVGVLFSGEDPVAAAKLFQQQLKENDKLAVKAGFFEGDVLDAAGVEMVSKLPSKEELLVTLLRTIQEGPRQILGVIRGPARDLLYLLNNYANKLEGTDA
jgi:large subunit ribosomal protein L10